MWISILTIILSGYLVLVFVANFSEGQYDIEYDIEYSSIPIHPSKESASRASSFSIERCQPAQNKTMA